MTACAFDWYAFPVHESNQYKRLRSQARLNDLGETVVPCSSADFTKRIAIDADKWANVIRRARISVN